MRFQLTDYQIDAVSDVMAALREGAERFERSERLTAVSLSAPTGAGKTVIATAVIERILCGDENTDPNPNATIVWVTDDPSLNQQTKRKMLLASSQIRPDQLMTVDQTLDQRTLDPGRVYFIHIQQLGRGSTNYVRTGDRRRWSLWETIGTTIHDRGTEFLLIVDEAHRGTAVRQGAGKTITAQLIEGAGGALPPSPVVLGLSATPTRFIEAVARAGQRTLEPIGVDPEAVRESGLIKDKIRISHPTEHQPSDVTLLHLAVDDLRGYDDLWRRYANQQDEPAVAPALVVQVKAGASQADLSMILETLSGTWNLLDGKAIGHSFQDHTTLVLGDRTVRYIAPQDIQDDPLLRVVLFKEALTTGWDCPRAEVMFSFRAACDYTYIAQLIGRMVRTPLARRIATDDLLNSVALYLPYYDSEQVREVVAGIQSDESQIVSRIEVSSVTCPRDPQTPSAVWELLATTPTYTRPAKSHRNEVARLNSLATLLVGCAVYVDAIDVARRHVVATLDREAMRLGASLAQRVSDLEDLEFETLSLDLSSGAVERETRRAALNTRNIDDLFRRAKRILGDAAAKWYWDALCEQGMEPSKAKANVVALADDPTVAPSLESAVASLIDAWRTTYNAAINDLPDAKRAAFYTVWRQAQAAQEVTMIMPDQVTAAGSAACLQRHVYANSEGYFPVVFTGWETAVLETELRKDTLVAWYRNPSGGTAALAVPYDESGRQRTLYPDFLFFHEKDGVVVADIVDPHRPDAADTGPKWSGLARYASRHRDRLRRVLGVVEDGEGRMLSIDLKNPDVASRLDQARNETDVRAIFADLGGIY